jgi:hypothetical protein
LARKDVIFSKDYIFIACLAKKITPLQVVDFQQYKYNPKQLQTKKHLATSLQNQKITTFVV